jgi:hypothetical protein
MPPAAVPSAARVSDKWSRRASNAGEDYKAGIETTPKSWQAATTAGAANYKAGVAAAATAGRFERGVAKAGDARWKRGASEKGSMRYGPGVQAAQGDYAAAIGPVLEVIGRTDLPPRGPAGTDGNYARSAAIGRALRAMRTGAR